jgi:transcriptional regulator with XRE-family HTH domain
MPSLKVSPDHIDYVRSVRKERFSTVHKFAEKASVVRSTASKFLNGYPVNVGIFMDLANTLGLDYTEISIRPGGEVLVLDDEKIWLERFREKLTEFNCHFFNLGDDLIRYIEADKENQVKVIVIDEYLLIDDQLQPDQGSQIRARVRKKKADVKFIIISQLSCTRNADSSKAEKYEKFVQLNTEPSILDVIPKDLLEGSDAGKKAGYKKLLRDIRSVIRSSTSEKDSC